MDPKFLHLVIAGKHLYIPLQKIKAVHYHDQIQPFLLIETDQTSFSYVAEPAAKIKTILDRLSLPPVDLDSETDEAPPPPDPTDDPASLIRLLSPRCCICQEPLKHPDPFKEETEDHIYFYCHTCYNANRHPAKPPICCICQKPIDDPDPLRNPGTEDYFCLRCAGDEEEKKHPSNATGNRNTKTTD